MRKARSFTLGAASVLAAVVAGAASGGHHSPAATVGTALPAGFPTITDASLGTPVLGFGAAGRVKRTPVIVPQAFVDRDYSPSEIWGSATRATSATWRRRRQTGPRQRTRRRRTWTTSRAS